MNFHPYLALKLMPAKKQAVLIGFLAWVTICTTLGVFVRSPLYGLLGGLYFLLPLAIAITFTYRCMIRPMQEKLLIQEDWQRPKTAALTAGVFIAFITVVIMFLLYLGLMTLYRYGFELLRPYDLIGIDQAKESVQSSLYFSILGPVIGAWAWIPLGFLQGCLLMPLKNKTKN